MKQRLTREDRRVTAMDGYVYEKSAIERWLQKNNRSPLTNEVLVSNATVMATHTSPPTADMLLCSMRRAQDHRLSEGEQEGARGARGARGAKGARENKM